MTRHSRKEAEEQWKERLREKAEIVRSALNTDSGKALFGLMSQTFESGSLKGEDPHDTYYRLGQRDVVAYLRELSEVTNVRDQ